MKILAIHNIGFDKKDKESAVQIWRVWRPLEELKKHVDWQIDYQKGFIKDIKKYKDLKEFTAEEVEKAGEHLGKYDIVFSSYHADAGADALIEAVCAKYGTKYIIDDDDNTFAIDPDNPYWQTMTHDHTFVMQRIMRTARYISTTTDTLKDVLQVRSEVDAKIFTLPNYISDAYSENEFDNGDKIVIGYAGGAQHYNDLHDTGFLEALQKLMHENKNIYFKCVGVPVDTYTPRARTEIVDVKFGRKWTEELFPTLNFDISVAPLIDTSFSVCKSNIKWQESTRMGAAFVASNVEPYSLLADGTAVLTPNDSTSWYKALKELVNDKQKRQKLVKQAKQELQDNWRLEDEKNWSKYKQMFQEVYDEDNKTK